MVEGVDARPVELASGSSVSGRRLPLDGLRTVAILAVFGFHCIQPRGGGFLGVDVFFALSGYLMTGIIWREIDRSGKVDYRRFLVRRFRRLYPALIVAVILGLALAYVSGKDVRGTTLTAPAALAYVSDLIPIQGGLLDHTWSLSVEAQFYALWPFALLVARHVRRPAVAMWVATAVAAVLPLAVSPLLSAKPLYFSPIGHVAALLAGSAVALSPRLSRRTARIVAPASAVALLLLLAPEPAQLVFRTVPQTLSMWVAAALTCALLAGFDGLGDTGLVAGFLSWRPLAALGLRSYGFYLFHQPVLYALHAHMPILPAGLLAFVISLALCVLSWRYWETRWHRPRGVVPARSVTHARSAP